jgi:hypothetical protein
VLPDEIYRTPQQLLKVTLETHNEIDAGLHFHTNVYIAVLMLLTARDRAEKAKRPHSKLATDFIGVSLNEVDVFACLFHLLNTIYK